MSSPNNIRPATKTDAETLAAIHRASFPNYWNVEAFNDFFGVAGTFVLLAMVPQNLPPASGGIKGGDGCSPVTHPHLTSPASRGGVNAGMMVYRVQQEQAEIITLAVLPSHRRQGIARELLKKTIENCRAAGASELFLDVEDGNLAAMQLYETHGFSFIRRRKLYYRQKDGSFTDALVMAKKLA